MRAIITHLLSHGVIKSTLNPKEHCGGRHPQHFKSHRYSATLLLTLWMAAQSQAATHVKLGLDVEGPVGIGYQPVSNQLLVSRGFIDGASSGPTVVFNTVSANGALADWGYAPGVTQYADEVKIEIVRETGGGWIQGEVLCGTGVPGEIARISPQGVLLAKYQLTGLVTNELIRGGLALDYDNVLSTPQVRQLVVVTTQGGVFRVAPDGTHALIQRVTRGEPQAQIRVHLEGVTILKNDPIKYGSEWAGRIVAGSSNRTREPDPKIWRIDPATGAFDGVQILTPGGAALDPEDLDIVPSVGAHSFYTVNLLQLGTTREDVYRLDASEFTGHGGSVIATVEEELRGNSPESRAYLYRLDFNGNNTLTVTQLIEASDGHFEHSCFAPLVVAQTLPKVGIEMVRPVFLEGESDYAFRLRRLGNNDDPLNVVLQLSGTATPNSDYSLSPSSNGPGGNQVTVTFPASVSTVDVQLVSFPDIDTDTETLVATIAQQAIYEIITGQATATVSIASTQETVAIVAEAPDAVEYLPSLFSHQAGVFVIHRAGVSLAPMVLNYAVASSSTATYGVDFDMVDSRNEAVPLPSAGSISFGLDEYTLTIVVRPQNDLVAEPIETVVMTITSGGYHIASPASATVTISDPPPAPTVSVQALSKVAKPGSPVDGQFRVWRTGDLQTGLNQVNYQWLGTATFGSHYSAVGTSFPNNILPNPLEFLPGQAELAFAVDAFPNASATVDLTAEFALAPPGGGDYYEVGASPSDSVVIPYTRDTPIPTAYTIAAIGYTYSGASSRAYAINDAASAQVAGDFRPSSQTPSYYQRAYRWQNGNLVNLGVLGYDYGTQYTYGFGVNNSGTVVGYGNYGQGGPSHFPFRHQGGAFTILQKLGSGHTQPDAALAINTAGNAVGISYNSSGKWRAVRWGSGGSAVTDLGTLAGPGALFSSQANDINSSGQIAGKSQRSPNDSRFAGFLTGPNSSGISVAHSIGTMFAGSGESEANALNDLGELAGACKPAGGLNEAFFRVSGAITDQGFVRLGFLPGGNSSVALGINSHGDVVGSSRTTSSGSARAFVVYNNSPAMVNLNGKLSNGAGWILQSAEDINDGGRIVGWGTYNGIPLGFILSPQF